MNTEVGTRRNDFQFHGLGARVGTLPTPAPNSRDLKAGTLTGHNSTTRLLCYIQKLRDDSKQGKLLVSQSRFALATAACQDFCI